MSIKKLQNLCKEHRHDMAVRLNSDLEAEFCEEARGLLESKGLRSETYEVQICRLHEWCNQEISSKIVAKAIGCSVSYAQRFSYDDDKGGFEKGWSKTDQSQKVSPGARTKIINRDNNSCLRCGVGGEIELEVHHILPINQGGTNDDSNLATLCPRCHKAAHEGAKSSGRTAYAQGGFDRWVQGIDVSSEGCNRSIGSTQTEVYDYDDI